VAAARAEASGVRGGTLKTQDHLPCRRGSAELAHAPEIVRFRACCCADPAPGHRADPECARRGLQGCRSSPAHGGSERKSRGGDGGVAGRCAAAIRVRPRPYQPRPALRREYQQAVSWSCPPFS